MCPGKVLLGSWKRPVKVRGPVIKEDIPIHTYIHTYIYCNIAWISKRKISLLLRQGRETSGKQDKEGKLRNRPSNKPICNRKRRERGRQV